MILFYLACAPPLFTPQERKIILRMEIAAEEASDSSNRFTNDGSAQAFGEDLFFDPRLSQGNSLSCSTCHDPDMGWADGEKRSMGLAQTPRHAPSLWGVNGSRWFNWDGSCDSLWCQATGPIEKPGEMGVSRVELVSILSQEIDLKEQYEDLFGALPNTDGWPLTGSPASFALPDDQESWSTLSQDEQHSATEVLVNIAKSLSAFQHSIVPPHTPLDDFVEAFAIDEYEAVSTLTPQQERGLRLFIGEGQCHLCHSGSYLSDGQFHNLGFSPTEAPDDLGRYAGLEALAIHPFNQAGEWSDDPAGQKANQLSRLTLTSEDLGRFKTPSLRQAAFTAPYMHTGEFETLYDVVEHYTNVHQEPQVGHTEEFLLPLDWSKSDIEAVVQFVQMASNTIQ